MRPIPLLWSALLSILLLAGVAGEAHAKKDKRTVVIAVGPDVVGAGLLQDALQDAVRQAEGVELVDSASIAGKLGNGPELGKLEIDPKLEKDAGALISEAEQAYYEDRLAASLGQLAAAQALYNRASYVPVKDRVKLLLWRTAVFLAMEDERQARLEANAVLTIHPQVEVDLSVYRPSVARLIDEVRDAGVRTVKAKVTGVPESAEIYVDDRRVHSTFEVPVGRHSLVVDAAGYKRVIRSFEIENNQIINVGMPLTMPMDMEVALLNRTVRKDGPDAGEYLQQVAKVADADVVVVAAAVVRPRELYRVFVWPDDKKAQPVQSAPVTANDRGIRFLQKFIVESVGTGTGVAQGRNTGGNDGNNGNNGNNGNAGNGGAGGGPGSSGGSGPSALALNARAGVAAVSRSRSLSAATGPGHDLSFLGVGPHVDVSVGYGLFAADLEAAFVSYDLSNVSVNHPQGGTVELGGGSTVRARLGAGVFYPLGEGEPGRVPGVGLSAGGSFESHAAKDVIDSGSPVGLFNSYQRIAVDVRASGRMPVTSTLVARAYFGAAPYSTWSDDPTGSLGQSPKPSLALGWGAGVEWAGIANWTFLAQYDGEMRSVQYSGQGTLPTTPLVTDAKVAEGFHGVTVMISRGF